MDWHDTPHAAEALSLKRLENDIARYRRSVAQSVRYLKRVNVWSPRIASHYQDLYQDLLAHDEHLREQLGMSRIRDSPDWLLDFPNIMQIQNNVQNT